jgi:hypothetical protein
VEARRLQKPAPAPAATKVGQSPQLSTTVNGTLIAWLEFLQVMKRSCR